ncbi:hypothetical protein PFLUV_G00182640 [Perca fluviatilis]|uniref:Uncharacterized protein n=1 Tax=Perca fluviatilis TaxID=8168 RepID=A0A6A5EM31_PERFL|nr:hypothetical protein PFLUV_G00182640 [Perca fluviatilis]
MQQDEAVSVQLGGLGGPLLMEKTLSGYPQTLAAGGGRKRLRGGKETNPQDGVLLVEDVSLPALSSYCHDGVMVLPQLCVAVAEHTGTPVFLRN